ncbi:hypothetical protein B0H66DRAFT_401116 [Apodospora peruviana]|uniref:Uncharacterized protein n=1 Tax=Apodospora peruviana TaxID=516989 RepID=A0AAE0HTE3_9PEZI|nr:hypothetical protein B0H66DRAFT_401116 [Apodospora peruviana]
MHRPLITAVETMISGITAGFPTSLETWRSCSPEQRYESWNALVLDYTLRSLTKETDKLVAFSGMARKFSSYDNSAYYAGIW